MSRVARPAGADRAVVPNRLRPGARATRAVGAVAVLLALALAACTQGSSGTKATSTTSPPPSKPGTLRILAGSELSDLEPLLPDLKKATGITVTLSYTGTLDGADRILHGTAGADAAWFSSDRYLRLLPGGSAKELARNPVMLSPVVLGVRTPLATQFGWTGDTKVTWADIAAKVASGQLTYAMTNPAASNSGFSALVGVAAAFAGTADALQASDIRPDALKSFFSGQVLTAGSSGWLTDAFVKAAPASVGAMINYESVLLSLQRSGAAGPLTIIRPSDGVITADYPMALLADNRRDEYTRVVNWLRSPQVQRRLQDQTSRRPAVPGVPLDSRFGTRALAELPFPATEQVADQLLAAYLDQYRRPTRAIYVLDTSGSMEGPRLAALQQALTGLTGADDSLSGRFARFRAREQVTIITFNDKVTATRQFTVSDPTPGSADLKAISDYGAALRAGGNTAIYSALDAAYTTAAAGMKADPSALTSIVLMTDGENNRGLDSAGFLARYNTRPPDVRGVRTFAVDFGDADRAALTQIATSTGGAVFDATAPGVSLSDVFREIRGYQ
ncbi:vWA domain-containing protein [Pseudofrankia inefficax]|uniref:von Willebrand factor type A n=1 Tax=Pseudofrankia inefficax (strain DSM 45817 / CECT 9037 / DDB 130130 / EuI1c) TaxID=298654 RepID=E3IXU5_PSEI1|nr:substrate-binding domain-containing protein [Pseudofrankia inefficax]ADP80254.1 von Willebrand factor type A [Pseudofrankia inefficax]